MLEPLAPFGGMPESLAPREMTCINKVGLSCAESGDSLTLVALTATLGLPMLSASQGGMPELLSPC